MFNQDRSLTVEAAEHPLAMPSGVAHDPPTASYSHLSPLCFHGLTNCFSHKLFALINICVAPRVSPPTVHAIQEFTSRMNQLFYRQTVMNALSSRKKSSALESATSTLFHKNTRGGVCAESTRPHQSVG